MGNKLTVKSERLVREFIDHLSKPQPLTLTDLPVYIPDKDKFLVTFKVGNIFNFSTYLDSSVLKDLAESLERIKKEDLNVDE